MSTWAQIKSNLRIYLNDISPGNFSVDDINDSTQDAYNEIVALSQCIVKKQAAIPFVANNIYYDMTTKVTDYLATTAIFNNGTNLWLLDDKTLKDFDKDRIDFENWKGQPIWWAPCNDMKHIAIVPALTSIPANANFDLYYWATAPAILDTDSPLIPSDFEYLIDAYCCADLLEQFEEFSKAQNYWQLFFGQNEEGLAEGIFKLLERSKNLAQSDLLMLA